MQYGFGLRKSANDGDKTNAETQIDKELKIRERLVEMNNTNIDWSDKLKARKNTETALKRVTPQPDQTLPAQPTEPSANP